MALGDKYKVWVELDSSSGLPIKIIKSRFDVFSLPPGRAAVAFVSKKYATEAIRLAVFDRNKDIYGQSRCQRCDARVTLQTGHMDHRVAKSDGGETSIDNCWILCAKCHVLSETSEHGDRVPKFTKTKL